MKNIMQTSVNNNVGLKLILISVLKMTFKYKIESFLWLLIIHVHGNGWIDAQMVFPGQTSQGQGQTQQQIGIIKWLRRTKKTIELIPHQTISGQRQLPPIPPPAPPQSLPPFPQFPPSSFPGQLPPTNVGAGGFPFLPPPGLPLPPFPTINPPTQPGGFPSTPGTGIGTFPSGTAGQLTCVCVPNGACVSSANPFDGSGLIDIRIVTNVSEIQSDSFQWR